MAFYHTTPAAFAVCMRYADDLLHLLKCPDMTALCVEYSISQCIALNLTFNFDADSTHSGILYGEFNKLNSINVSKEWAIHDITIYLGLNWFDNNIVFEITITKNN